MKKPISGARMSATVSARLSLEKYFCSFSNKISCVISESIPVPYSRENDSFAFQIFSNIAITARETRRKDSVRDSPTTLYKEHQTEQHYDCGLWTVDNGCRSTPPWKKNSSAHIVIFQRFLKFAIAKMEMSNSSSLPLTPPCCEAWSLVFVVKKKKMAHGGQGGIPFESDRNVCRLS